MARKKATSTAPSLKALGAQFIGRAKAVQDRFAGHRAQLIGFGTDNFAAVRASGEAVAAGVKPLVLLAVGNTESQFALFRATAASMKGAKSPVELVKLQNEGSKAAFAAARADTRAFTQALVQVGSDAAQPLKNRLAAVRKLAA